MTDQMTPERLDEIEARANAATQGPWEWHPYMGSGATLAKPNRPFHELNILKTTDDWPPVAADAEFIAAARTDVPALLAEVRRLQDAVERVRALHQDEGPSQGYFPGDRGYGERDHCCGTCGEYGEYGVEWPCPTIAALGGDEQ